MKMNFKTNFPVQGTKPALIR